MVYTVYILYSKKDEKLYVGCTHNIEERVRRHSGGFVQATKNRRPLMVIHTETFLEKSVAFQRERFLKSLWSSQEKRKILQNYLDSMAKS